MNAETIDLSTTEDWRQYICRACGLIYDERLGDADSGLAPGTRFDDIPDDWECPICGVTKTDFEPYTPRAVAGLSPAVSGKSRKAGVVIVGAGIAGWSVAEALRRHDASTPVTVVTACAGDVYHKPELSVALARGQSPEALRRATGAQNAARLGVRLLDQAVAIRIQAGTRQLRTTRGPIAYSHLVLAQGARPASTPSLPSDLCWRINDLDTWTSLHQVLQGGPKRVAVVGAGMVGCELAEDLARAGHHVTMFSREEAPVAAFFPPQASARVRAGLERLGVSFIGAVEVERVIPIQGDAKRVTTTDGRARDVDVVISAIGLATHGRLALTARLSFQAGIAVDRKTLQTSVSGIYGIGDCISIDGKPCRFIEPVAKQAEVIAREILGIEHAGYDHADPVVRLKTRSAPIAMHGVPTRRGEWRVVADDAAHFAMEQWQDGEVAVRLSA